MENRNSSFAILPSYIMDDENLDEGAKILYARIAMYSQDGRCWASNQHFADKQKVCIRTIQKWLKQLIECGHIEVEIETGGFQTKRNIWILVDFKKRVTKCTTVHPHATYNSPTPEPVCAHININKINIKEDTAAREGAAAAAAEIFQKRKMASEVLDIDPCLQTVSISDRDKRQLTADYSSKQIEDAIAWAHHPKTKITKSLASALKWACKIGMKVSDDYGQENIKKNLKLIEEWGYEGMCEIACNKCVFYDKTSLPINCNPKEMLEKLKQIADENCQKTLKNARKNHDKTK